jgi:hypothetical protein
MDGSTGPGNYGMAICNVTGNQNIIANTYIFMLQLTLKPFQM